MRALGASLLLLLVLPASAQAGTVEFDEANSFVTYEPTAGDVDNLVATTVAGPPEAVTLQSNGAALEVDPTDVAFCTGDGTTTVVCTAVDPAESLIVNLGLGDQNDILEFRGSVGSLVGRGEEGDDHLTGSDENVIRETLFGGDGTDQLFGRGGNELLRGDMGADTADGGPGRDQIGDSVGEGNDNYQGGEGVDLLTYASSNVAPPDTYAVDLTAGSGGRTNYTPDLDSLAGFEDVNVDDENDPGDSTVTGNATGNAINVGNGNDVINGLAGADLITVRGGNDTIEARDGAGDFIRCGSGVDSVQADQFDEGTDCETFVVSPARPDNADLVAPTCELSGVKATYARAAFFKGFRPAVACSEPATLLIRLVANVKRGKLVTSRVGDLVLAEATVLPGAEVPRIRAARRFMRQLSAKRGFRARLEIEARDQFGNSSDVTKTVKVKKKPKPKRKKRRAGR